MAYGLGPYGGVDYITSPYVESSVDSDSNICTWASGQPYSRVDHYPLPESAPMPDSTLFPSQGLWIWPLACLGESTQRIFYEFIRGDSFYPEKQQESHVNFCISTTEVIFEYSYSA